MMTFISNTFYNLSYSGQSFNGNGWSQTHNEVISKNNLFIDSFSGNFNRRIRMQGTKVAATFENNCYWYNGALPLDETSNRADGDKSNSAYGVIRDSLMLQTVILLRVLPKYLLMVVATRVG